MTQATEQYPLDQSEQRLTVKEPAQPEPVQETHQESGAPPATEPPAEPAPEPEPASLDPVIQQMLAEALALQGAPATVTARVRNGVVLFSGQVDSRELAAALRETARNFDGVSRVTGVLRIGPDGERVGMDALPD